MKECPECGREYGDDVTVCPEDATPLVSDKPAPAQPVVNAKRSSTLAVTSLILGILSIVLCLGPVLGIPAVICGHIASSRSNKNPAQFGGGRMAIGGLVTGYIGIILIIIFAVLYVLLAPAFSKAKEKAGLIVCSSKLLQVELAMRTWSANHNGLLPTNLLELTNELSDPNLLICPEDHNRHGSGSRAIQVWDPDNVTYQLVAPGVALSSVQTQIVIRCPVHGTEILGDGTLTFSNSNTRVSVGKANTTVSPLPNSTN